MSSKKFTTSTQIQHLHGTSSPRYTIPSLKQAYQDISGSSRTTCCVSGCSKPYSATAHVQINDGRKNSGGNDWFLVPTCTTHNRTGDNVQEVVPSTQFVSVKDVRAYQK